MKLIEDYGDMPSLEFSTAAQVVITIWNRDDIVRSITQCLDLDKSLQDTAWKEIIHRVQTIVRSINYMPNTLLKDMDALITPIGFHIKKTRTFLNLSPYIEGSNFHFPVSHWTSYGTVDTKRLEEMLVRDSTKAFGFRYKLACNDCIERDVEELFSLLTSRQKYYYLRLGMHRELLSYWTHRLSQKLASFRSSISSPNVNVEDIGYSADQIAFKFTLMNGNRSGIEYFLTRLIPEDSEVVLKNCFLSIAVWPVTDLTDSGYLPLRPLEHFTDALYFLFPKLSENLRSRVLRTNPFQIYSNFLMYPFYGLFYEKTIQYVSHYSEEQVFFLIRKILSLYSVNMHLLGYEPIRPLWDGSSTRHQDYVIRRLNALTQLEREDLMNKLESLIQNLGNLKL